MQNLKPFNENLHQKSPNHRRYKTLQPEETFEGYFQQAIARDQDYDAHSQGQD